MDIPNGADIPVAGEYHVKESDTWLPGDGSPSPYALSPGIFRAHIRNRESSSETRSAIQAWPQTANESIEPLCCPTSGYPPSEKASSTVRGMSENTEASARPPRRRCPYCVLGLLEPYQMYIFLPKKGLMKLVPGHEDSTGPLGRNGDDFLGQREAAPIDDQSG